MAFLSVDFFALLAIAVPLYHVAPESWRRPLLLALSYAYYCTFSLWHAILLAAATALAYWMGLRIEAAPDDASKRRPLAVGVAVLVAQLLGFKYAPAGVGVLANLLVPLGISYYTFKLISYLFDVYWEKLPAARDIVAFGLYPAFFPQIVSGPIQRPGDFLRDAREQAPVSPELIVSGLRLVLFGLFKKLVIADRMALMVNRVFDHPTDFTSLGLLVGCYGFAIQLYADFSGVTDLAIGVGRLFGIRAPQNFDAPFYAPNVQEFWRRWHITLTSWLTDYLFTPLRMQLRQLGNVGLVIAITANMVAIGCWHGPRWTFAVFGAVNALYMVVSALTLKARNRWFKRRPRLTALRRITGPVVTFHLIVLAFILVRVETLGEAWYILRHLVPADMFDALLQGRSREAIVRSFSGLGIMFDQVYWAFAAIPLVEAVQLAHRNGRWTAFFDSRPTWLRWSAYYAAIVVILLFGQLEAREFIYAHF